MKRSEINRYIAEAIDYIDKSGFRLPPFAFWSPDEWKTKGEEADEIRENGLGWDVTDYGLNEFMSTGLLLFTIRNGNFARKDYYPKGYAEKIMVVREDQITPFHYHWNKREDIINRGGGELLIELYLADDKNGLSDTTFSVAIDGVRRQVAPGDKVTLTPGESICLEPYIYHSFWGKTGAGTVLVGEVSDVNDDNNDNCFLDKLGRYPKIIEDELPLHYLCTEYPKGGKLIRT
ncbi:MAG: D-lyxose/D-mannose family sugar isomerase [Desulfobulbaceae bacterium S5133MH15]|nr:MAG: D-lyxose/D-mannose family sugar isomerase [Desulfobulbaceae bacterium S5133MH15]